MFKPIRQISASTPSPNNSPTEPSSNYTDKSQQTQDECSNPKPSFSSIYGGTTAAFPYTVSPSSTEVEKQERIDSNPTLTPQTLENYWSTSLQTVLDQPPATLPLRLMLGGMAFCLAFAAWATLGKVQEVGHAQGQLIPKGEPYKINPIVVGKVARIAVKEGETVKAGQVLLELDNQIAANDVERLQQERTAAQTQLTQTQALIDKTYLEVQTYTAIAAAGEQSQAAMILQAQAKVEAQMQTIAQAKEKTLTLTALLTQLQMEANAFKARRERLQSLTKALAERLQQLHKDVEAQGAKLERLKPLVQQGAIAKERLYDAEQTLRDRLSAITQTELQEVSSVREQLFQADQALRDRQRSITQTEGDLQQANPELDRLQAELKQAKADLNRLLANREQNRAEVQRIKLENQQKIQQLEVQKTQLQAQVNSNEKQLSKAQTVLKQFAFTAPVDGVVLSLNVRNPGEVVQPGQIVAELAPQNTPLVLMAKLPNREAGFVKTGMAVKVKLDAYPYQDYGIISGKVLSISADAKPDQVLGAVYRVEVALEQDFVNSHGQKIQFKPGQTASADIIIRDRRIVDVLLEPIQKMKKDSLNL